MKISINKGRTGYTLWLSARDTYDWAHRVGHTWPCSTLSKNRCRIDVDSNGLCDFSVNGKSDNGEIDGCELDACVSNHIPLEVQHLWPTWKAKV